MLEVLKQFVCDECGAIIESPQEGFVEWENRKDNNGKRIASGFRIVHHIVTSPLRGIKPEGCYRYTQHSPHKEDRLLSALLPVATPFLMTFLNPGCFRSLTPESHYNSCRILNFYEFTDFARRLTIPYYEEARIYFEETLEDGINFCDEETVFEEMNLLAIIRRYGIK